MNRSATLSLAMDLHRILRELPTASTLDSGQDLRGAIWKLEDYSKRSSDLARELLPSIKGLAGQPPETWTATLEAAIRRALLYAGGLRRGQMAHPDLWRLWLDVRGGEGNLKTEKFVLGGYTVGEARPGRKGRSGLP